MIFNYCSNCSTSISLFGHRLVFNKTTVFNELYNLLENKIIEGYNRIYFGNHGDFDNIAKDVCCKLKDIHPHIELLMVITNITSKKYRNLKNLNYEIISFPIEQYHYKQRIIKSNEIMIDKSDLIICYLDKHLINNSGVGIAIKYAQKQNKEIINLF